MQNTFWYVYKRFGGAPHYKHTSESSAIQEAQRLVDELGGEYEILEAKAIVKAAPKYVVEQLLSSVQIMDNFDPPF
jgi:K+-sensing histidine kinase KdpD